MAKLEAQSEVNILDRVVRGVQSKPRRCVLYGVHGIGKSTWASKAPNPIFIPTEDGLADIDTAKLPLHKSLEEVIRSLRALYSPKHDYKTVVIDSLDWLEQLIWHKVCEDEGVESIEKIGYAKGYVYAVDQWRKLLDALDSLRNDRGLMIILIAHHKIVKFDSPSDNPYSRYVPAMHDKATDMILQWCDECLFVNYKVSTRKVGEDFNQNAIHKAVDSDERVMYASDKPFHAAANRLAMPSVLPFTWEAYADYINRKAE